MAAISEGALAVRQMAFQFADLYFMFVSKLRDEFGEDKAEEIARGVLFERARERALAMIKKAEELGMERSAENINKLTDVPFMGWVAELGAERCPYGAQWNRRIAENPWFRRFAALYCDVTDTTMCEIFTGDHSHKLHRNVVLGDSCCRREYFPSEAVASGHLTYAPDAKP